MRYKLEEQRILQQQLTPAPNIIRLIHLIRIRRSYSSNRHSIHRLLRQVNLIPHQITLTILIRQWSQLRLSGIIHKQRHKRTILRSVTSSR